MGRIGLPEILIILVILLLLFGAKKLPEIGKSVGDAMKQFRKAGKDLGEDKEDSNKK